MSLPGSHFLAKCQPVCKVVFQSRFILQIIQNGCIYLFQCQGCKSLYNGIRGLLPMNVFIQYGFNSNTGSLNPNIIRAYKVKIVLNIHVIYLLISFQYSKFSQLIFPSYKS